jgi:hypothetical protein
MSEAVVLCEGFHDRAFWAGWLLTLGCTDPGLLPDGTRRPVLDPWNKTVVKGQYGYQSVSGEFVRVQPCRGIDTVLPATRLRLGFRATQPLRRLVVCVDPDTIAASAATGIRRADVLNLVREFDPAALESGPNDVLLDGGATVVSLVRWEASDPDAPGIPAQQTLERLVCASICAAYPDRGAAIKQWLESRPAPPPATVKEFAWSHMAGWYAMRGCENFYQAIWEDGATASQLEVRLRGSGAWGIAEELAK